MIITRRKLELHFPQRPVVNQGPGHKIAKTTPCKVEMGPRTIRKHNIWSSERAAASSSERRTRPFRLLFLDLGLARHRDDAQRGDAIALAAQHAETEAVEGKALAALGDRARLVDHKPRDRGRLLVGQMPVHRAVEI